MNRFKVWAADTAKRAVKTAAQAAVAMLGADQAELIHADLRAVALTALGAGVVSILQNLANLRTDGDLVVAPGATAAIVDPDDGLLIEDRP